MVWTKFWDMLSGGSAKEFSNGVAVTHIYIEAPIEEAKVVFYTHFGHNPERVTCTCCGDDYSIEESESLEQATAYHRMCDYAFFNAEGEEVPDSEGWTPGKGLTPGYTHGYVERLRKLHHTYLPLTEYLLQPNVIVIRADEIKPTERTGTVPAQGYVWVD